MLKEKTIYKIYDLDEFNVLRSFLLEQEFEFKVNRPIPANLVSEITIYDTKSKAKEICGYFIASRGEWNYNRYTFQVNADSRLETALEVYIKSNW